MILFRLARFEFAHDLSGRGAYLAGGRWNSIGLSMLYTSSSRALCVTEIAVHMPLGIVPKDYYLVSIEIPDSVPMKNMEEVSLPASWNISPHRESTRQIGDEFLKNKEYLLLKVPSVVVQDEYNYLVNPKHPEFKHVKIIEVKHFQFDQRLFKK
jgi:RES domain-containing protein